MFIPLHMAETRLPAEILERRSPRVKELASLLLCCQEVQLVAIIALGGIEWH